MKRTFNKKNLARSGGDLLPFDLICYKFIVHICVMLCGKEPNIFLAKNLL